MEIPPKPGLTRRDRSVLDRARRNGYLEISREPRPDLVRAHGLWCWKLRIPFLCFARDSPRSRFGTVRLDLFTTPHLLTEPGRTELTHLPARHNHSLRWRLAKCSQIRAGNNRARRLPDRHPPRQL